MSQFTQPCHFTAGAGQASDCALEGSAGTGSGQQETALQGWWPQGPGSGAHGHGEVPPHGPPAGDVSANISDAAFPPSTAPPSIFLCSVTAMSMSWLQLPSGLCLPVAESECDGYVSFWQ